MPKGGMVPCPTCGGEKRVWISSHQLWAMVPGYWIDCTRCDGTGEIAKPCELCHGDKVVAAKGAWVLPFETDTCPRCNGTGEEPTRSSPLEDEGGGLGSGPHGLWG